MSARVTKAQLRRQVLAKRASTAPPERAVADAALVAALLPLAAGRVVAAYAPIVGEPGGEGLPDALAAVAAGLLLPVLRDDLDLDWAGYDGALAAGRFGLREPTGPRLGTGAVAAVDLIVVPAVAVDRHGLRLGRGGGSYDRVLPRVPAAARRAAVIFEAELLDWVPAEPHDARVDTVVVPSGVISVEPPF